MRLVVEFGTAKFAAAPGYVVGGKTGTAEKNKHGRYEEKTLVSTFIGAFPMTDPRYVILALVDEPHGDKETHGYATAGWTVAPATSGSSRASRRYWALLRSTNPLPPSRRRSRSRAWQENGLKITELMQLPAEPPPADRPTFEPDIAGLTVDSRQVRPGFLFAACHSHAGEPPSC